MAPSSTLSRSCLSKAEEIWKLFNTHVKISLKNNTKCGLRLQPCVKLQDYLHVSLASRASSCSLALIAISLWGIREGSSLYQTIHSVSTISTYEPIGGLT